MAINKYFATITQLCNNPAFLLSYFVLLLMINNVSLIDIYTDSSVRQVSTVCVLSFVQLFRCAINQFVKSALHYVNCVSLLYIVPELSVILSIRVLTNL